jgi:hypothetical protein
VIQWLTHPEKYTGKLIHVDDQGIWFSPRVLRDQWSLYHPSDQPPDEAPLARAIDGLTDGDRQRSINKRPVVFRRLDPETLYAWADVTKFVTRQEIHAAIAEKVKV